MMDGLDLESRHLRNEYDYISRITVQITLLVRIQCQFNDQSASKSYKQNVLY